MVAEETVQNNDVVYRAPLSFVRRTERLTHAQQREWDAHRADYMIDAPRGQFATSVDAAWVFEPGRVFGRSAPLTLEIGTGRGDNIVAAAHTRPDRDFVGLEVYIPGLAQTILRAQTVSNGRGLPNLRLLEVNAPEFLSTALAPASVNEVWVFFPDPWPKKRHHKRRLVSPPFLESVARVLVPGGRLRLATDWAHYAEWMVEVCEGSPHFVNACGRGGMAPRFGGRVLTAFEQRGIDAGRTIVDLDYQRIGSA